MGHPPHHTNQKKKMTNTIKFLAKTNTQAINLMLVLSKHNMVFQIKKFENLTQVIVLDFSDNYACFSQLEEKFLAQWTKRNYMPTF